MNMRVEHEVLPPCVQDGGTSDLRAEELFVGREFEKRLCRRSEKQRVNGALVLICQGMQFLRDGENHVKIACIEKVEALILNPAFLGKELTLGTVPVAARIVGRLGVSAGRANVRMNAHSLRSAIGDIMEDLFLLCGHAMGARVFFLVCAKDVLHLNHGLALPFEAARASSGLRVLYTSVFAKCRYRFVALNVACPSRCLI